MANGEVLSESCLDCASDIIFAIDRSASNRLQWTNMVKQTKAILRAIEHDDNVEFGIEDSQSKVVIQSFPLVKESPALTFDDYNHGW